MESFIKMKILIRQLSSHRILELFEIDKYLLNGKFNKLKP